MQNQRKSLDSFRFPGAPLCALLTVVALGMAVGGCNSSSSSPAPKPKPTITPTLTPTATATTTATASATTTPSPTPSPSKTGGLWVPNLFGPTVNEFGPAAQATSGTPPPQFSDESAALLLPAAAIFDGLQNLWVSNCNDVTLGAGTITEFTAAQLANLGTDSAPAPNISLIDDGSFDILHCPWGEQFDAAGNLWVANRLLPNLVSFTPAQLAAGGAQTPNTTITSTSIASPRAIAFDASANLWIVENTNLDILGYKAATLATALGHSGVVNPDIIISSASFVDPRGLAFDTSGDLWICDATGGELFEFAAASLGASGSLTPTVTITATPVETIDGITTSLDGPDGLAFDPSGNLWVSNLQSDNAGSVAEFTAAQLATSGNPSPAVFLDSDEFGLNIHQPALLTFGPIP